MTLQFLTQTTAVAPANAVTLYHGTSLGRVLTRACRSFLTEARPDVVQPHAGPSGHADHAANVVADLRRLLPGVRLWLGVGADGWARDVASGALSVSQVVTKFMETADIASDLGCEAVVWNGEEAYKDPKVKHSGLAHAVVATCADLHPRLVQMFTSYDHPTYHPIDWQGWIGAGSPVQVALPQVYAAGNVETVRPARGALPARQARALASWQTAVRQHLIKPDVEPDTATDVDWMPYLQAHSVLDSDSIRLACTYPVVSWWAAMSRMDDDGRRAIVTTSRLRRLGFIGPTGVVEFQRANGLKPDGIAGPLTQAKAKLLAP